MQVLGNDLGSSVWVGNGLISLVVDLTPLPVLFLVFEKGFLHVALAVLELPP